MFKFHFALLIVFAFLVAACAPSNPAGDRVETTRPAATAVIPTVTPTATPTPLPSSIESLLLSLTITGATGINNGRTEQGLFPGDDIYLWHLTVNGTNINVFEFSDTTARTAVSQNISPRGDEYTVSEGETTITTHWDGESYSRWWARDNLLVGYSGADTAVADLLTTALGQPFADGSQPYRPEPYSGSIAGIGEYGVSFQYDPYLAAGITAEMTAGRPSTGPDDFIFDVMPDHITFTFLDTYATDWPIYHQTINIPHQPQILIFPLEAYASLNPIAQEQIAALDNLLQDRPDMPDDALPHLPPPNGQQDLQAQLRYLTFQNGEGIRYLTQFNQEPRQINNQEIYYTFQGITADHTHYIAAFFPIHSDSLPADNTIADYDAFASNMPSYLAQTTADLNALPLTAFTPDLALLDFVIESLLVQPTVEWPTPSNALPDPAALVLAMETSESPDGRWRADAAQSESVLIIDRDKYYVSLTVTDGTVTWTPMAEWRNDGLGALWLAVYRWSVDGRYLYYTNTGSVDGCSMFVNGTDLYRLDVSNGKVVEILPEGKTLNLSLSPDESMLAYASYDGQSEVLVVQDLATGAERSVRLFEPNSNTQMSEIFWSGDGKTAVLTLIHGACSPRQTSSIVRINIEDMTTTTLITDDERFFRIQDWPNPEQVEVRLLDKDGNTWWLEINSGELAQEG